MNSTPSSVKFDEDRADRAVNFFEKILVHTRGRFARKPFILTDWQRDDIIRPLFGAIRYDEQSGEWVRKYHTAWLELARGNGKSELVAGIMLLLLCADDEEQAEIYGAAKDRDQAGLVFATASRMVELSPLLSERLEIFGSRKTIVDPKTASSYRTIAADAAGNLGQNPHGIGFDEVAVQPSRDLWDALKTGMGKRTQPLMVAATTAGNDPSSFGAEEHEFSARVAVDSSLDPSRLVYMRNTPPEADPWDEKTWYFANPALGDFLSLQTLRDEAAEANIRPSAENAFRQFRLNQWVSNTDRWISTPMWDQAGNSGLVSEEKLRGQPCYGGLELASTADFTAWIMAFPRDNGPGFDLISRFWLPASARDARKNMRGQLDGWERQGFLTITEGDVVDYPQIKADIERDAEQFSITEFAYNRWNATQLVLELVDGGIEAWTMNQTTNAMNPGTKELERLIGLGQLNHGGNPVLRWMAGNAAVTADPSGNIRPDKKRSGDAIAGMVALVMALSAAIREREVVEVRRGGLGF